VQKEFYLFHWIFTLLVLFHGLAHLVYTALAQGWIPVTQGQENWTGTSWLLASRLDESGTRTAGAIVFALLALSFVFSGIGVAFRVPWATSWLANSSILSSGALFLFWDGSFQSLGEKGIVGLAINVLLLTLIFVFKFPTI
jgi:hypothetical protein